MKLSSLLSLFSVSLLSVFNFLNAQENVSDSTISMWNAEVRYLGSTSGGDLADRFGFIHGIGLEGSYKTNKNYYIGAGFDALFGGSPKETIGRDVLFYDRGGQFAISALDIAGQFKEVRLFMRGYKIPVRVGKVFPIGLVNPNSGIDISVGPTFFQHKVNIEVIGGDVRSLDKDNRVFYDRLTNGVGGVGRVAWRHYGNNNWLNFTLGFEASYVPTQSRRDFNLDLGARDDKERTDILYGFTLQWNIPIYERAPEYNY